MTINRYLFSVLNFWCQQLPPRKPLKTPSGGMHGLWAFWVWLWPLLVLPSTSLPDIRLILDIYILRIWWRLSTTIAGQLSSWHLVEWAYQWVCRPMAVCRYMPLQGHFIFCHFDMQSIGPIEAFWCFLCPIRVKYMYITNNLRCIPFLDKFIP